MYVLDLLQKQSEVAIYMINDKFHMSSKRNESVCQETKHEVCFGDESNYYCSCGSFHKERVVCKHFFTVIKML